VEVATTLDCGITLVLIPPGSFVMGDDWPTGEGERQDGPPHRVTLSRPF
jgi:formylglycine-generating enzyme required for sulfatase activity